MGRLLNLQVCFLVITKTSYTCLLLSLQKKLLLILSLLLFQFFIGLKLSDRLNILVLIQRLQLLLLFDAALSAFGLSFLLNLSSKFLRLLHAQFVLFYCEVVTCRVLTLHSFIRVHLFVDISINLNRWANIVTVLVLRLSLVWVFKVVPVLIIGGAHFRRRWLRQRNSLLNCSLNLPGILVEFALHI